MKITPLEIRQHEFEKTFRGYNIEEVDNFLANLSQEWERILNESKMLRMQLEMAEKEAGKLREIEMTLFKTLKTAEDTSNMITEQANQQADKNIQESKQKSEELLREARAEAEEIVREAKSKAKYIKEEVLGEVKLLERDFKAMYQYKDELLTQMRNLSNATLEHVHKFEEKFDKEDIGAKIKEAFAIFSDKSAWSASIAEKNKSALLLTGEENTDEVEVQEDLVQEPVAENADTGLTANVQEDEPDELKEQESGEEETVDTPVALQRNYLHEESKSDELEIIEGIGPKIAMLLYDAGIFTFKDLATTPVYKVREVLESAGPAYAMHDPSTWVEQALLAAEGRFEELEEMKDRLVGGRPDEDVEEKGIDNTAAFFDTIGETPAEAAREQEAEQTVVEPPKAPEPAKADENNIESITEEMLEKVNKVKEAIRKAMVEKEEKPAKDVTPLPTVKDVVNKSSSDAGGGSFFDNI